jgi:hypothetical protein
VVEYGEVARDQSVAPATFAALSPAYELAIGELTLDLTQLPWTDETIDLVAEVGVGRLEVILPPNVEIEANTEVGIGASINPNDSRGGLGVEFDYAIGDGTGPRLITNLDVGIGEIEVRGSEFERLDLPGRLSLVGEEDIVLAPLSGASVEDSYAALGDGDLTVDLSGWEIEDERFLTLSSENGDILVVLPPEASYLITATGPDIVFDGQELSGTLVTEAQSPGQPTLHIDVTSIDGTITIEKGSRS